jgi:uncharacterized membrane protein YccC
MSFISHFQDSLKTKSGPAPIDKMLLSALAIVIPLLIGISRNELNLSMFGSLFTLILYLIDHFGPIQKRVLHLVFTFIILGLAVLLGYFLTDWPIIFYSTLFLSSLLLGRVKNKGLELERLILFAILYMITIADSPSLKHKIFIPLTYAGISFLIYISFGIILSYCFRNIEKDVKSKRSILKKALIHKDSFYFSIFFAVICTSTYYFSKFFNVNRPYWITGTTLIVMIPDTIESLKRAFQRILGTILGVIVASWLTLVFPSIPALIIFAGIFSFFIPLGMVKNYWVGNVFIAGLIIIFLETSSIRPNPIELSVMRITDISIGAFIGAMAILIWAAFEKVGIKIKQNN